MAANPAIGDGAGKQFAVAEGEGDKHGVAKGGGKLTDACDGVPPPIAGGRGKFAPAFGFWVIGRANGTPATALSFHTIGRTSAKSATALSF